MGYGTITFTERNGIATLMLNRPGVKNALNGAMRAEITEALTGIGPDTRCVVLTGAGDAFCSGQDLGDASDAGDIEGVLRREYEPMLRAVTECRAPVIAAVNGVAAGAGANLALAADVAIAVESASFVQAFTRIGLVPDAGGTWFLPRSVGTARAAGLMLFADRIPAAQAAEWGMIWEAVPADSFVERVHERARQLADGPTGAFLSIRRALRESGPNTLAEQLELEAELQGRAGRSADFREGVAAFLEKRPARFTGE